nr:uncharacterized protein LOC113729021 [Coffea arabica]
MTLRSDKKVHGPEPVISKDKDQERIEKELEEEGRDTKAPKVTSDPIITVRTNPPPFPNRLEKPKKQDKEKEVLEIFHKMEINISLLDAIKQVPRYAKFLRDLCVNRRRLKGDERVVMGENVSAILQRKLPPKCGDPGLLKETGIIIQLTDRTNAYPDGLIEDVLVKINELVFPTDFYVLDMEDKHSHDPSPLLLGRSFLSTVRTKIDDNKGTLSMEFDGEIVYFNIFETMKYPSDSNIGSVFSVNVINSAIQEAPVLELKPLPKHLKYAYLGEWETFPVIISASLSEVQEDKLIRVLREHKQAIGWTIANIKGINPAVVPKKAGVTVESNQEGDLVPVRKPTGWRQCYFQIAIALEDQEKPPSRARLEHLLTEGYHLVV